MLYQRVCNTKHIIFTTLTDPSSGPSSFSHILNDGPDDTADDGSPHWPVVRPVGPSSFILTHRGRGLGYEVLTENITITKMHFSVWTKHNKYQI